MVDALKLAGVFSPAISRAAAGIWSRNQLSRFLPINISTCISNVPGPGFPLYCAGAKMVDYYGLGVLTPGMGVFHLVFSYAGKVTLSVLADRDIMPDPEHYHDFLVDSYREMFSAAVGASAKAHTGLVSPKRDTALNAASGKAASAGHKAGARRKSGAKPGTRPKVTTKAGPAKMKTRPKLRPKGAAPR
jgi:hypothetical protein